MRLRYLDAVFDGDPGERVKLGNGMFYVSPQIGRRRRRRRRLEMWRGRIGKTHCRRRRRRRHWIRHKPKGGIIRCWLIQELIYRRIIFRNWFSVDQNLIFCLLSLTRFLSLNRWGEMRWDDREAIEENRKLSYALRWIPDVPGRWDENWWDDETSPSLPLLLFFFFLFSFFAETSNFIATWLSPISVTTGDGSLILCFFFFFFHSVFSFSYSLFWIVKSGGGWDLRREVSVVFGSESPVCLSSFFINLLVVLFFFQLTFSSLFSLTFIITESPNYI